MDDVSVELNSTEDNSSDFYNVSAEFFYTSENYLHPLLQPCSITTTALALLGIIANIAGICSLIQHRSNKRDCTSSRLLLLLSLSFSDLAVCICVPLKSYVTYALSYHNVLQDSLLSHFCTVTLLDLLIPACETISLLNLLGMAIDHWITFIKPFRYFEIMSQSRATIMIVCFWTFSLLIALCEYLTGLAFIKSEGYSSELFCYKAKVDTTYQPEYLLLISAPLCLVAMFVIYVSISREINKLVVRVPPRQQDFGQAKRALVTTYIILLTFLICWLPCFCLTSYIHIGGLLLEHGYYPGYMNNISTVLNAQQWSFALLLINSILDPIIYMSHFRMRLTSLCENMLKSVSQKYSLVDMTERQTPCHTVSTMRSSVQFSAGGNVLCEPLMSSS